MTGSRASGGFDEFMKLAMEDVILNIYEPLTTQAVTEFPAVLTELRQRFPLTDQLSLVGASIGSMVVLRVLTETEVEVDKAALVSPAIQLAGMIATNEKIFGMSYTWSEPSRQAAAHLDFPARASEIGQPLLIVVGELDEEGYTEPAKRLWAGLPAGSSLITVPGMGHALAEEPGVDAAPQTPHAAEADRLVTEWLSR
jgi:pimeloyl-ACP methyl ester carboxylesterase